MFPLSCARAHRSRRERIQDNMEHTHHKVTFQKCFLQHSCFTSKSIFTYSACAQNISLLVKMLHKTNFMHTQTKRN